MSHQAFLVPALSETIGLVTSLTSISVLIVGLAISYFAVLAGKDTSIRIVQSSPILREILSFLQDGMWFDKLYSGLERFVATPLVRAAKQIQSGLFGYNMALLLSALVAIILLIAIGVI